MEITSKNPEAVDSLLTVREVAALLAVSVPTIWRGVSTGRFPRPVKLGASSRWPQSEILAVIEAAKAAREKAA